MFVSPGDRAGRGRQIIGRPIVLETQLTLTSSAAFTGIPAWVTRIVIMIEDLSNTGTANWGVQIGDSGGLETTGYFSESALVYAGTPVISDVTTMFNVWSNTGTVQFDGVMEIVYKGSDTWVASHTFNRTSGVVIGSGVKTLTGTLNRLSIIPATAFDAGTVNIFYE